MHNNEISIGDALKQFLNNSRLKTKLHEVRIQECWEKIMGKTISRYTDSIQLIEGKLVIATAIAPLKQELSYSKSKIIQLLNEEFGEEVVKEVIVK